MHIYTTNCMEEIETAAPSGIRLGGANFFTSLFSFHVNQHVAQLLDCCLAAMTLINLMRNYDDKFFSWSFQLWPRKGKEFVGKSNVFPQSSGITGSVLHRKVSSSPPHVIFVQKTDALWFWSCFFNLEIMFCFFNPKQEKKKKQHMATDSLFLPSKSESLHWREQYVTSLKFCLHFSLFKLCIIPMRVKLKKRNKKCRCFRRGHSGHWMVL